MDACIQLIEGCEMIKKNSYINEKVRKPKIGNTRDIVSIMRIRSFDRFLNSLNHNPK